MDGTWLVAQENLTLVVPLVFALMVLVYGIYWFRSQRKKSEHRKEQEVRKIFY